MTRNIRDKIINDYFNWMCRVIKSKKINDSYYRLLCYLHSTPFTYTLSLDVNRESDGIDLRYRFGSERGYPIDRIDQYLFNAKGCSVLEMMVALSIRCEETIMSDQDYGDRTSTWFWGMIRNLRLKSMTDSNFDAEYVENIIHDLLNRQYDSEGIGGLFTVRNRVEDMRDVEIWYQMCWYLNTLSRR